MPVVAVLGHPTSRQPQMQRGLGTYLRIYSSRQFGLVPRDIPTCITQEERGKLHVRSVKQHKALLGIMLFRLCTSLCALPEINHARRTLIGFLQKRQSEFRLVIGFLCAPRRLANFNIASRPSEFQKHTFKQICRALDTIKRRQLRTFC